MTALQIKMCRTVEHYLPPELARITGQYLFPRQSKIIAAQKYLALSLDFYQEQCILVYDDGSFPEEEEQERILNPKTLLEIAKYANKMADNWQVDADDPFLRALYVDS